MYSSWASTAAARCRSRKRRWACSSGPEGRQGAHRMWAHGWAVVQQAGRGTEAVVQQAGGRRWAAGRRRAGDSDEARRQWLHPPLCSSAARPPPAGHGHEVPPGPCCPPAPNLHHLGRGSRPGRHASAVRQAGREADEQAGWVSSAHFKCTRRHPHWQAGGQGTQGRGVGMSA